jgi:hypothetical protein
MPALEYTQQRIVTKGQSPSDAAPENLSIDRDLP